MVTFTRNPRLSRESIRDREEPSPVINRAVVRGLTQYRALALGKRTYRVPPIPHTAGLDMDDLLHRYHRLRVKSQNEPPQTESTQADKLAHLDASARVSAEMARWCKDAAAYCGAFLYPTYGVVRWLHKLLRALRLAQLFPNPLRAATEGELVLVLDFLWRCRTSDVRRLFLGEPGPSS